MLQLVLCWVQLPLVTTSCMSFVIPTLQGATIKPAVPLCPSHLAVRVMHISTASTNLLRLSRCAGTSTSGAVWQASITCGAATSSASRHCLAKSVLLLLLFLLSIAVHLHSSLLRSNLLLQVFPALLQLLQLGGSVGLIQALTDAHHAGNSSCLAEHTVAAAQVILI